MQKTYIFGHKKPDSDSVMSAIGLSYLKNLLGENTEPRILGDVNKETAYALKYFHLPTPEYLNDVKLQLKDIDYHKNFHIKETDSIYTGYQKMLEKSLTGIPITDAKGYFTGLITIKDLSHVIINENTDDLYTSYDNILHVLKGESLLKFDDEIVGRILVAAYRSTTILENVKLERDMVLIVGDRHSVIEYAVNSGVKLIILSGDAEIKEKHLEIARKNKVNIIRTPYPTYHITRLVSLTNYIKTMIRCYNPAKFEITEFVDNVVETNNKLKHTNYPIVDRRNKAGTSLEGMTKEDVLYNDFKIYTVDDKKFAIGQFFTMNFEEIEKDMAEYIHVLDEVAEANNYNLVALYVTDIIKKGSYVIFNTRGSGTMALAYGKDSIEEGCFIPGCVSRKKHVVPIIMPIFEN